MPRFYLVDQSLKGVGGHHFTYARDLLAAACEERYEVVVATHRRFRRGSTFPARWHVVRAFRHSAYDDVKEEAVFGDTQATDAPGVALARAEPREAVPLRVRHESFRAALLRMLRSFPPQTGDLALLPTCSLFDVASLARALASIPGSERVRWNVQFHSDFSSDLIDQRQVRRRRQRIADWLRDCLMIVPTHQVRFYATTDLLTHSYNTLNVVPFATLPHIVGAEHGAVKRKDDANAPLRVACLGGSRAEKGFSELQAIVDATWKDLLSTRRIQFVLQSKPARLWRSRPRLALRVGHHETATARFSELPSSQHVVYLHYPLSTNDYRCLLEHSDIGLFLYDRRSYQNRCSGVLTELLAAGKVAVVPGGCWLGSQVDIPNYQYREGLASQLDTIGTVRLVEPMTGKPVAPQHPSASAVSWERRFPDVRIPRHSTLATIKFPVAPLGRGLTRLVVSQLDHTRQPIQRQEHWGLDSTRPIQPLELIHLHPRASWLGCSYQVVGESGPLCDEMEFKFLKQRLSASGRPPMGGPGLSFASVDSVPQVLRDVVTHFGHYQRHAQQLAGEWQRLHHPSAAFRQLAAAGSSRVNAA